LIVVALEQVNRHLWALQGFNRQQAWSPEAPLSAQLGLYGFGPSLYPALLARHQGFGFEQACRELDETRALVRMDGMRASLFAVPRPHFATVHRAFREGVLASIDRLLGQYGLEPEIYANICRRILTRLSRGSLPAAQLKKELQPLSPPAAGALPRILARMAAEGLLVRARTRGSWKSTQFEWALLEDWLPGLDLQAPDPEQARMDAARLYLAAYGPATAADFRWWSGLRAEEAGRVLQALEPELAHVEIRGLPGEHLLLQEDLEALLSTPESVPWADGPQVSLLPVWDAYLMAYRARERYLQPEWYDRVYDRSGNSAPAILLDGRLAGVWDLEEERQGLTLKAAFFESPPPEAWAALRQAAEALGAAVSGAGTAPARPLQVLRCPPPPSLAGAPQNRFHHPLREMPGEPL